MLKKIEKITKNTVDTYKSTGQMLSDKIIKFAKNKMYVVGVGINHKTGIGYAEIIHVLKHETYSMNFSARAENGELHECFRTIDNEDAIHVIR